MLSDVLYLIVEWTTNKEAIMIYVSKLAAITTVALGVGLSAHPVAA